VRGPGLIVSVVTRPIPRERSADICGIAALLPLFRSPPTRPDTANAAVPEGGRPPAFDPVDYRGRNVVERRFTLLKQWRGLATRYDKLAIVYRSAAVLHAVITWTSALSDTP
jgi:transposase